AVLQETTSKMGRLEPNQGRRLVLRLPTMGDLENRNVTLRCRRLRSRCDGERRAQGTFPPGPPCAWDRAVHARTRSGLVAWGNADHPSWLFRAPVLCPAAEARL